MQTAVYPLRTRVRGLQMIHRSIAKYALFVLRYEIWKEGRRTLSSYRRINTIPAWKQDRVFNFFEKYLTFYKKVVILELS